jgi:hypothetical protein
MMLPKIVTLRRDLKLPPSLEAMIAAGTWCHPGADVLRRVVPFITDPLVVLKNLEHMLIQSGPLMGHEAIEDERLSEYRGSQVGIRELPWIDVEKTLFIMCNERPGDDVGIALDYRYNSIEPCLVGGDWHTKPGGIVYRLVAKSFTEFAEAVGLRGSTV